ncbi:MAG: TatD family hydrolase [Alphaproteobacteria bacterium]
MVDFSLTDSHCHLTYDREDNLKAEFLINEAQQAGVGTMLTICTLSSEWPKIQAMLDAQPNVFGTFGVHPNHVGEEKLGDKALWEMAQMAAKHPKCVGLGEAGLDYHYNFAPKALQQKRFAQQLEWAWELGLPLVIHTREAEDDTMKMVDAALAKASESKPLTLIFHCFTSSQKLADFGIERGIYFGATGVLTFNNSDELRATFATIPATQLLVETDSPYLAPMPFRGKQNRPAWVVKVAERLAKERDTTLQAVADVTTQNFLRAFPKVALHKAAKESA